MSSIITRHRKKYAVAHVQCNLSTPRSGTTLFQMHVSGFLSIRDHKRKYDVNFHELSAHGIYDDRAKLAIQGMFSVTCLS
jgi:hypothetical protein